MNKCAFIAVLALGFLTVLGSSGYAAVGAYPYSYGWTSAISIAGDGNWSTTKSAGGNEWTNALTGGNLGPDCARMPGFKNGTSRLRVDLNLTGKFLDGSEEFNFVIKRDASGTVDATVDVQWSSNGGTTWTTFSGGTFTLSSMAANTYELKQVFFPSGTGMNNSTTAAVSILVTQSTSAGSVKCDTVRVDDVTILGGALPIQLASFTASVAGNNSVRLEWGTISELNNYGFYIQRRGENDHSFIELENSFVPGHGTTNVPQDYTYTDNTVPPGAWYYRLRQQDLDGTSHYSDPVFAGVLTNVPETAPREFALLQNYPNPFNPSTEIKFSVEATGRATLRVYNLIGQDVAILFDDVAQAGQYYKVTLNAANLTSGLYFYTLESGNRSETRKMILMK